MILTEPDYAWCAGVIDTLGLVKLRPSPATGTELAYVAISSPRIDILERLAEMTGSTVVTVNRQYNRLGCDEHCTEPHVHVHSTTGRWSLTGAKALVFLSAIQPYVHMRREEIDKVLAVGSVAPRKLATVEKMAELGWPVEEWEAS